MNPEPGEIWTTSKGRTVEILARDTVTGDSEEGYYQEIDAIAYKFLGGTMIHLRAVSTLTNWTKAEFQ